MTEASDFRVDVPAYLARIGYDGALTPGLATLAALQLRHLAAIPFENLAAWQGQPVSMELDAIQDKLLYRQRGGYCFENNQLFHHLLRALGFDARALMGRVVIRRAPDAEAGKTHLFNLVTIDGVPWLVDVGFGGMNPRAPVRIDTTDVQHTGYEPCKISMLGDALLLSIEVAGQWLCLYRFTLAATSAIDYSIGNWYVSTSPDSHFTQILGLARILPNVRLTLRDRIYSEHRIGMESVQEVLSDPDALIDRIQSRFGIAVPDPDALRNRLDGMSRENVG